MDLQIVFLACFEHQKSNKSLDSAVEKQISHVLRILFDQNT